MYCSDNDFCSSLPVDLRGKLCAGCRKRFSRAGSLDVFESIVDKAVIVLDGVMVNSSQDGRRPELAEEIPHYSFSMPGRLLHLNAVFDMADEEPLTYISMSCLTDCCLAVFDREFILNLCESDARFARRVSESSIMLLFDHSKYAGIMRAEGAFAKVVLLMKLLTAYDLFLPERSLAEVLACDRTTVSRAGARIREELPDLWRAYLANKTRPIVMLHPESV